MAGGPWGLCKEDRQVAHMAGTGLCFELVLYEPPEAAVAFRLLGAAGEACVRLTAPHSPR